MPAIEKIIVIGILSLLGIYLAGRLFMRGCVTSFLEGMKKLKSEKEKKEGQHE